MVMGFGGTLAVVLIALASCEAKGKGERVPFVYCNYDPEDTDSIYNYVAEDIYGERNISLSEYKGKQEPGNNASEILNGIKYVRPGKGFEPNFQMFSKIDVNGEDEIPLYTYLKSRCPSTRTNFADKNALSYNRFLVNDVRWNWEKFLISKTGKPVKRYDASTDPFKIRSDIEVQLRRNY